MIRVKATLPPVFLPLSGLLALATPVLAQVPRVSTVFPPGVRRGATATVTLTGQNLKPGSRVLVSGEGISAEVVTGSAAKEERGDGTPAAPTKDGDATKMSIQLQVAADATPEVRELRVLGPNGASNATRFAIGTLPELRETEPNNQTEEAQALTELPVVVYGRVESLGDQDTFRFRAGAGETWVFELGSASHGSGLDGYLVLRDARGRELATLMEALNQDPRLIHPFATAGEYTLSVRDVTYRGGPESTYRLSMGQLPTVTRVLPLGVPRGQTTTVQLAGVNLGGLATMHVSVPADYSDESLTVVPKTPAGDANPMRLVVNSVPEGIETEPNDDRSHATRLASLPAAVSGVIGKGGDVDVYAFRAEKDQRVTLELFGRRLGTRLDSFLKVLDGTGKELASNDDAMTRDSRLVWTAPSAGDFYLQVTDLSGEGGDRYGYRLEVTPAAPPDFKLSIAPDVLNMGQGGSEVLTVRAERLNDFAGDIELRVEGLPEGIAASQGAIRRGQDTVEITLTAAPETPKQGFPLQVTGATTLDGKKMERVAQPMEGSFDEGRQRPVHFQVAGVGEPGPYTLVTEPRQVSLAPGATVTVAVKVTRRPDVEAAKGEIDLEVSNVPEGVTVKSPAIPADKSEGTIELKAPEKLDPRTVNLIVRGRLKESAPAAPALTLVVVPKPADPSKPAQ